MKSKILILIGLLIFMFSCCNDDENTDTNTGTIVGKWVLESVFSIETQSVVDPDPDNDDEYGCNNDNTTLEFFEIENGILKVNTESMFVTGAGCPTNVSGNYEDDKQGTITFISIPAPKQKLSYTRTGEELTITDTNDAGAPNPSNFKYTFKKMDN